MISRFGMSSCRSPSQGWSFTSLLQRARQLSRRFHAVAPAAGCVGLGLDEGIPMVLLHVAVLEVGRTLGNLFRNVKSLPLCCIQVTSRQSQVFPLYIVSSLLV